VTRSPSVVPEGGPARWAVVRAGIGLGVAVVFGVALAASMSHPDPLDDADLAYQRAGILDVVGPRSPAPTVSVGVPTPGRRAVVFFVRPAQAGPLQTALDGPLGDQLRAVTDVAFVVSGELAAPAVDNGVASRPVQVDPTGRLAMLYRMRRPRDGGAPVGYAVVGPDGTVRYRTEDPGVAAGLEEVRTIVRAVS